MTPFSLFLFDDYIGDGMQDAPISHHYFCRDCGTVWARSLSYHASFHDTLHVYCPDHDTHDWGAALLCQDIRFRDIRWPRAALERDFLYLSDPLYRGRFISNNLPRVPTNDQHQAA